MVGEILVLPAATVVESTPPPIPEPAPPATPEERRLTPQEWQAEQAAAKRQLEAQEQDTKAQELITNAPVSARDLLDTLAEELDVRIPADLRKPLLDLVQDLTTTGIKGGELKWKGRHDELKETLDDTSLAFFAELPTPKERQQFAAAVGDKGPTAWVKALIDLKTPAISAKALEDSTTAQAALLPEGAVRDGFTAKVRGERDAAKIAQAFHDALVGVVGPKGEPQVAARGSGGGEFKTMREVRAAHSRREITTPVMREYQERNRRGDLPD